MASLIEALELSKGGVVSLVGAGGKTSLMFRLAKELSEAGDPVLTTTTTKMYLPTPDQSPETILCASAALIAKRAKVLLKSQTHISAAARVLPSQPAKVVGLDPQTIEALKHSGVFRWILVEADGASRKPLKVPAAHEPVVPACSGWVIGLAGLKGVGRTLQEKCVFRADLYAKLTHLKLGERITENSVADVVVSENGIFKGAPPGAGRFIFLNLANQHTLLPNGRRIAAKICRTYRGKQLRVIVGHALETPAVIAWEDADRQGGFNG